VRTVLELAGIRNILAKQLGSNNPLNNARAAINALGTLRTFAEVAEDRGIPVENLYI
jgi:small subunit ribosomal protein S5